MLCFCSLLLLRPTVKLSKWNREIQENVQMAKAKNVYTFKAAEKGECSESSYNWYRAHCLTCVKSWVWSPARWRWKQEAPSSGSRPSSAIQWVSEPDTSCSCHNAFFATTDWFLKPQAHIKHSLLKLILPSSLYDEKKKTNKQKKTNLSTEVLIFKFSRNDLRRGRMEFSLITSAVVEFIPAVFPEENGPSMQSMVMSHLGYAKAWIG